MGATWPPRYDPAWRPAPDAEHWAPGLECAEPKKRDEVVLAKLRAQVQYAWERSPFYRRRWEAAGVSPARLRTLADLAKFPVVQKADLRAAQAAAPPFGAGLPGQTLMAVQWAREMSATAFYGTPSYALHFAETARREGIEPRDFGFRTLFFSGEPGAGVAATKRLIEATFGGACIDMG